MITKTAGITERGDVGRKAIFGKTEQLETSSLFLFKKKNTFMQILLKGRPFSLQFKTRYENAEIDR